MFGPDARLLLARRRARVAAVGDHRIAADASSSIPCDRRRDLERVADLPSVPRRRHNVALVAVIMRRRKSEDAVGVDLQCRLARDLGPLELDIDEPIEIRLEDRQCLDETEARVLKADLHTGLDRVVHDVGPVRCEEEDARVVLERSEKDCVISC